MIGYRVNVQKTFFDSPAVIGAMDKATRRVLSRFGAYVRRTAQKSIVKRKKASEPGQPPSSHTGLLKRFIYFAYEPNTRNVVIGPVRLAKSTGEAPSVLEHGGTLGRRRNPRRRTRVLGGAGEIRIGGPASVNTKKANGIHGKVRVTYGILKTQDQVARANRLNEEIYGPMTIGGKGPILARPYMHPAFQKEKPKLPQMWRDSLSKGAWSGAAYERAKGR